MVLPAFVSSQSWVLSRSGRIFGPLLHMSPSTTAASARALACLILGKALGRAKGRIGLTLLRGFLLGWAAAPRRPAQPQQSEHHQGNCDRLGNLLRGARAHDPEP